MKAHEFSDTYPFRFIAYQLNRLESAEQSFKTWEENRTVGSTVRKNIHSATLMLVQKLFSFGRSGQQTDIKQLTVDTKAK